MNIWSEIVEVDPRIERIADVAERLVRSGDPNVDHPDAVYTDAKPYLKALLDGRGSIYSAQRRREGRPYEGAFEGILREPMQPRDDREQSLLSNPNTYQAACTHVYDGLCEIYDRPVGGS